MTLKLTVAAHSQVQNDVERAPGQAGPDAFVADPVSRDLVELAVILHANLQLASLLLCPLPQKP